MAHTQSTDLTTPRQNAKETDNDNLKTNKMSKLEQRKCSIHGKTLVFCTHTQLNILQKSLSIAAVAAVVEQINLLQFGTNTTTQMHTMYKQPFSLTATSLR